MCGRECERGLLTFDHLVSIFYIQMAADVHMKQTGLHENLDS